MVKHVHIELEDYQAALLEHVKGNRTWLELLLSLVPEEQLREVEKRYKQLNEDISTGR